MKRLSNPDRLMEQASRALACRSSRRGILASLARLFLGAGTMMVLPIDRLSATDSSHSDKRRASSSEFAKTAQTHDDAQCNYWRYCAIDGALCSCCGGTADACPPGTVSPPTAWVGSCTNPEDNETYLVVYRDCCGKDICKRCECENNENGMPLYRPQLSADHVWCYGTDQMAYHCTHSAILGKS